tara:strand:+ start:4043 stop:4717 length:675 start_codon:yes stop_codon:yes gene_type:complete
MPVIIDPNVFTDSPNLTIYYKINSDDHNNFNNNDDSNLTAGIELTKNVKHSASEQQSLAFIKTNTITVKSHLPNIGYYDIELVNSIPKNIIMSDKFYNWYDPDGSLKGLVIDDNVSIQGELEVRGNITAFANNIFSDIRLKNNVKNITNGLEIINKLRPVSFTWKNNNKKTIGFIAQEVEEILPEFVRDTTLDDKIIKTIKQDKLIAYIVDSIKNISNRLKKYE